MHTHPIIFFLGFLTWGFHSHFVGVKYTIKGPIGNNVVWIGSFLHSSPYSSSPPCVFPSSVGDMHIVGPTSNVVCFFITIIRIFSIKTFSATNKMCSLGFDRGWTTLYHFLLAFLLPTWDFVFWAHWWIQIICWIVCGWGSSWRSWMIFIFLKLINLQVAFAMLSLHYAQHLGYLLHTMFQSLNILQHYTVFNTHTIASLEKLLNAGSFGVY
jgi:hypothetical protein